MHEIAKKIGVKVVPLKKRGEVKIIFGEELEIRLSQRRALALLLWIYNRIYNIKNKEEGSNG